MHDYIRRHLDSALSDLLGAFPALMITGPRGCGKTTTAQAHASSVMRLDDAQQAAAFGGGPDAFLASAPRPLLIDEWQEVPASLSAVKRAVDQDYSPGQFLITGSVRSRLLVGTWPGTGRVIPVRMWGLTQAELIGRPTLSVEWLWSPSALRPAIVQQSTSIMDYIELALSGGFPEGAAVPEHHRRQWYAAYIEHLVDRDTEPLAAVRNSGGLNRLLSAVGLNTAGLPSVASLAQAAQIDQRTAGNYLDIIEDLRVVQRVRPWFRNQLTSLVKTPKYYVTDSGLAAALAKADRSKMMRDGTLLGRLIDTFVAAQLRPLIDLSKPRIELMHLRDSKGRVEVDMVLESPDRGIVGIEVKAAAAVSPHDARHLAWLRDSIGDEFAAGYVLHTGPAVFHLGERIWALPIAALWQPELALERSA